MKDNYTKCLTMVLEHEGKFSDHPSDSGGATMKGVTLNVFRAFYGDDKTVEDLKNITQSQLSHIYKIGYWNKCQCDSLPSGIDYAVFDAAIMSGPHRSVKWLQEVVDTVPDGIVGIKTITATKRLKPQVVASELVQKRLDFLEKLSNYDVFGRGWRRRVRTVSRVAQSMSICCSKTDMDAIAKGIT